MADIKKRAISPEQKAERRQHILAAAAEMFLLERYDAVKMASVASAVGITKPALYRYFRSKEVLFLALFEQQLGLLRDDFKSLEKPAELGATLAAVFAARPLYCRLSAILHTVLERDLTYDEALAFKQQLKSQTAEISKQLASWMETDDTEWVVNRVLQLQHAVIGVWHMSHPVGAVKKVLERDDMAVFRSNFEETLAQHITTIIRT
ncbi:MAG: TetR family transcriptional regulator [Kordiimonadales bacterium]|nr:MAG: TetR family transcriptional regulator [Kordiimonadales bacterium]